MPKIGTREGCAGPRDAVTVGVVSPPTGASTDGSRVMSQTAAPERGANFWLHGSSERMGVSIGHRPGRETTRALLEKIAGGEAALKLRRQVVGWNPGATEDQVEDAFQEACARAERSCHGQAEGEVYTWLRTTTHHCLGRMRERRSRERIDDHPLDELDPGVVSAPGADVAVLEREKHAEVEVVARVVLAHLTQRQLDVAALYSRGFRRREIAERLHASPRVVKRLMEQVLAIGRAELAEMAGRGCDAGHDEVARFAFGLAGPRDARRAQLHLATCERCGAMYERLDLWREKVAVLLPVPPAVEAHAHVVERVAHAGTELVSGDPSQVAESPPGMRRHVSGAISHLRDQTAAAYYRTVDPSPLAGARPGAVAAAVAGCLAIGGGTTYCVQQGADPLTALTGLGTTAPHHHEKKKPHVKRAHAAQAPAAAPAPAPAPPVVTPTVTVPPQTVQQAAAPAPAPTTTAAPPPSPKDQFEPTSAGASSQTATQASASKPTQPAPASASGPSEFGGP